MEDSKPPAPPVGADAFAHAEVNLPAGAGAVPVTIPRLSARQFALKAEKERLADLADQETTRAEFHTDLKAHLAEANHPELNTTDPPHPTVHEHAALRGFKQVKHLDPVTMTWVDRPCWQMQALVARFHAHGLRHDARISHEHFEQALHEALSGRV